MPDCINPKTTPPETVDTDVILADVKTRIAMADAKHGDWSEYNETLIADAVGEEFNEYVTAYADGIITGRHGQIDELYDLAAVAIKGIRRLHAIAATQTGDRND